MAEFLPAAQPRIFKAILASNTSGSTHLLEQICIDTSADRETRMEAAGWKTFLKNQATFPKSGDAVESTFQYWNDINPPSQIQKACGAWESISKQYSLYNENTAKDFIQEYYGKNAATEFKNLWHPALQSDVFRIYRLATCGGLYCDADSLPQQHAKRFLQNAGQDVWFTASTRSASGSINNGLISAPPKHPLIEGFLKEVLNNLKTASFRNIYWLSGPGALTKYIYESQHSAKILTAGQTRTDIFKQFDASYKYSEKNWRVYEYNRNLTNDIALEEFFK